MAVPDWLSGGAAAPGCVPAVLTCCVLLFVTVAAGFPELHALKIKRPRTIVNLRIFIFTPYRKVKFKIGEVKYPIEGSLRNLSIDIRVPRFVADQVA